MPSRAVRPTPKFTRLAAGLAIAALPLAHALAAPPAPKKTAAQANAPAQTLTLRTAEGRLPYFIDAPGAFESTASRAMPNRPLLPGYQFRARVHVFCSAPDAPGLLAAIAAPFKAAVAPADPTGQALAHRYALTASTLIEAAALADALAADARIAQVEIDALRPRADRTLPTDPAVPLQWYLSNPVNPIFDTNVEPAWDAGFTGAGITVGILEGGFDISHPDLAPNVNATASQPPAGFSSHGTATAGLVGMTANNALNGAGIAYDAKLARLYYGFDPETAAAFLFRNDLTSIKSNSWGPFDNGTVSNISAVELAALRDSTILGRAGKGTVFTWAAGNGGASSDRVDYDPYASSRYALAIGAIGNNDLRADYSEPGSALMLVTTSGNDFAGSNSSGIYSTAPSGGSTSSFGGTSTTSPLAAGIVALVLQASPNLTWRDVAHVLINSARKCSPTNPNWSTNGAGRWQHYDFGFGAIDAAAAVSLAQTWTNRPPERDYLTPALLVDQPIADNSAPGVSSTITIPANMVVERVQLTLTAVHQRLGDLRIELTSPSGSKSLIADTRFDFGPGYQDYTFTTVRHWDENPRGSWTLNISDREAGEIGSFSSWRLNIIGTAPRCPCDWNRSGSITVQDIFDFLTDWFTSLGDFNNDSSQGVQDIFDFLTCWFSPPSGC
jgi:subtilisin-like proprotein convertase family protein